MTAMRMGLRRLRMGGTDGVRFRGSRSECGEVQMVGDGGR